MSGASNTALMLPLFDSSLRFSRYAPSKNPNRNQSGRRRTVPQLLLLISQTYCNQQVYVKLEQTRKSPAATYSIQSI
jgi:hypothetical protein